MFIDDVWKMLHPEPATQLYPCESRRLILKEMEGEKMICG